MNFGAVQSSYGQLRKRLVVYVGAGALPDITIDPPKGVDDELSFIRLVMWGYVLVHETGRVPLGFLRQLPPWQEPTGALLPHIRALRTWSSHNLAFDKAPDVATLRAAIRWFKETCGVGTPASPNHWGQCCAKLCSELKDLMDNAVSACDAFEGEEDKQRLIDELLVRLNSDWAAHRFDRYVEAACVRIGYKDLDLVKLRTNCLPQWRKVVATSWPDGVERNLQIRIEADLVALMGNGLPLTGDELSTLLITDDSEALVAAMLTLRSQKPSNRADIVGLLRQIAVPNDS